MPSTTVALASALAAALRERGIVARPEQLALERLTRSRVGDFRFDATPFMPPRASPKAWAAQVAEALDGCVAVESCAPAPPRVYVRPTTSFLYEHVVASVRGAGDAYGDGDDSAGEPLLVCYCSPNANKPLHIGHLRINALGMAMSRLLAARGYAVTRTEMLSNYGIHVCQALAAYQLWGENGTPASTATKGDHYVGEHYVQFHTENAKQRRLLDLEEATDDDTEVTTQLEHHAADLLRRMEAGDAELLALNERFTAWAIDGIRRTYTRIGTQHELVLLELDTLPLAKHLIERAAAHGGCARRPDGSLYVDVPDLGEFTVLRRDGTPLVYTQLLGIWVRRRQLAPGARVMHITGRQWDAGVAALLELLRRTGHPDEAHETEAVYYGMVRLAGGKIRSRQGTILGLDGVLDRLRDRLLAGWSTAMDGLPMPGFRAEVCERLAVAVAKFEMLRVPRDRDIVFDEEAFAEAGIRRLARVVAALRQVEGVVGGAQSRRRNGHDSIRQLLIHTDEFPDVVRRAAARREPADVARFLCGYAELSLTGAAALPPADPLLRCASRVMRRCLQLLNIDLPASLVYLPDDFLAAPGVPARAIDGAVTAPISTSDRKEVMI